MFKNSENCILFFAWFLVVIFWGSFVIVEYPVVFVLSGVILILLLLNVFYGIYNNRKINRKISKQFNEFKENNGYLHTVKTSGSSRTFFLDGNNKPDEYLSFVKDFLLVSFRKSELKYVKINKRYEIYFNENYSIVQDNEKESLSLLKSKNIL